MWVRQDKTRMQSSSWCFNESPSWHDTMGWDEQKSYCAVANAVIYVNGDDGSGCQQQPNQVVHVSTARTRIKVDTESNAVRWTKAVQCRCFCGCLSEWQWRFGFGFGRPSLGSSRRRLRARRRRLIGQMERKSTTVDVSVAYRHWRRATVSPGLSRASSCHGCVQLFPFQVILLLYEFIIQIRLRVQIG